MGQHGVFERQLPFLPSHAVEAHEAIPEQGSHNTPADLSKVGASFLR